MIDTGIPCGTTTTSVFVLVTLLLPYDDDQLLDSLPSYEPQVNIPAETVTKKKDTRQQHLHAETADDLLVPSHRLYIHYNNNDSLPKHPNQEADVPHRRHHHWVLHWTPLSSPIPKKKSKRFSQLLTTRARQVATWTTTKSHTVVFANEMVIGDGIAKIIVADSVYKRPRDTSSRTVDFAHLTSIFRDQGCSEAGDFSLSRGYCYETTHILRMLFISFLTHVYHYFFIVSQHVSNTCLSCFTYMRFPSYLHATSLHLTHVYHVFTSIYNTVLSSMYSLA